MREAPQNLNQNFEWTINKQKNVLQKGSYAAKKEAFKELTNIESCFENSKEKTLKQLQ